MLLTDIPADDLLGCNHIHGWRHTPSAADIWFPKGWMEAPPIHFAICSSGLRDIHYQPHHWLSLSFYFRQWDASQGPCHRHITVPRFLHPPAPACKTISSVIWICDRDWLNSIPVSLQVQMAHTVQSLDATEDIRPWPSAIQYILLLIPTTLAY